MKSLTNAGKMLAVSSAVLFSTMIGGVAAADASTNTAVAQNTNTCYAGTVVNTNVSGNPFTVVWNGDNSFTINVTTPLHSAVHMYLSDYVLTSPTYKGGCFGSTGSTPQTWNKTVDVNLVAGFSGSKTVSVDLPTTCGNVQADLYTGKMDSHYGMMPLNGTVTSTGHSDYGYIAGNIMATAKNTACQPGKGGDTPVPPTTTTTTPTTPQVLSATTAAPAAAQLTDTGLNTWVASLLAVATMGSALFVARKKAVVTNDAL